MTLPLKVGGTTVTVQRMVEDAYGDHAYTDAFTVDGCMTFPSFSTSGRVAWRSENTSGGQDVVTQMTTLYMPYGSDVRPTDRLLLHPDGMEVVAQDDVVTRKENTFQVLGEPMPWKNMLTGWSPALEVALTRVF